MSYDIPHPDALETVRRSMRVVIQSSQYWHDEDVSREEELFDNFDFYSATLSEHLEWVETATRIFVERSNFINKT